MTIEMDIPNNDNYELIPLFNCDYATRVDSYIDPATGAPMPANDVNLFLLVVKLNFQKDAIMHELRYVKRKIKFFDEH